MGLLLLLLLLLLRFVLLVLVLLVELLVLVLLVLLVLSELLFNLLLELIDLLLKLLLLQRLLLVQLLLEVLNLLQLLLQRHCRAVWCRAWPRRQLQVGTKRARKAARLKPVVVKLRQRLLGNRVDGAKVRRGRFARAFESPRGDVPALGGQQRGAVKHASGGPRLLVLLVLVLLVVLLVLQVQGERLRAGGRWGAARRRRVHGHSKADTKVISSSPKLWLGREPNTSQVCVRLRPACVCAALCAAAVAPTATTSCGPNALRGVQEHEAGRVQGRVRAAVQRCRGRGAHVRLRWRRVRRVCSGDALRICTGHGLGEVLLAVALHVRLEAALLRKACVADQARKRLLARVHANVTHKLPAIARADETSVQGKGRGNM